MEHPNVERQTSMDDQEVPKVLARNSACHQCRKRKLASYSRVCQESTDKARNAMRFDRYVPIVPNLDPVSTRMVISNAHGMISHLFQMTRNLLQDHHGPRSAKRRKRGVQNVPDCKSWKRGSVRSLQGLLYHTEDSCRSRIRKAIERTTAGHRTIAIDRHPSPQQR